MLNLKLVAYLQENPAVFSKILERLLVNAAPVPGATFNVRRKDIILDPGEEEGYNNLGLPINPRRQVAVPVGDDNMDVVAHGEEVAVDDVKLLIISDVVRLAEADGTVLANLISLATVSRALSHLVEGYVNEVGLQFNAVSNYCRALFDYYEDPRIFNLFRQRVQASAPATHAGWLYLEKKQKRKEALTKLIKFMKTARPQHYELALQQNGWDPVATVLAMHDMAFDAVRFFTHSDVQKMYQHVYGQSWLFCLTRQPHLPQKSGFPRFNGNERPPTHHDALSFNALVQRNLLDSPDDLFESMSDFLRNMNRDAPPNWLELFINFSQAKPLWKRLCRHSDFGGFLRFAADLYHRSRVMNGKYIGKMLAYWLEVQLDEGKVELPALIEFATNNSSPLWNVRYHQEGNATWLMSIAYAILAARKNFPTEEIVKMFKHVFGDGYESEPMFHDTAWSLLFTAIKRGNSALVRWLLETPPEVLTVLTARNNSDLVADVMELVCAGDFVMKRDRDGSMQTLVLRHLCRYFKYLVESRFYFNVYNTLSQSAVDMLVNELGIDGGEDKWVLATYRFQASSGRFDLGMFLRWVAQLEDAGNYECLDIALYKHTRPRDTERLLQYVSPTVKAGRTRAEIQHLFYAVFEERVRERSFSTFGLFRLLKEPMMEAVIKSGAMTGTLIRIFVTSVKNPLIMWKRILAALSAGGVNNGLRAAVFDAMREMMPYRSSTFGTYDMANIFMYAVRTPIYHELSDFHNYPPKVNGESNLPHLLPPNAVGVAMDALYKMSAHAENYDFDIGALEHLYVSTRHLDAIRSEEDDS